MNAIPKKQAAAKHNSAGIYEIINSYDALKRSRVLKHIWSEESRLTQRILIYIAQLLEQPLREARIEREHLRHKNSRSGWHKFLSEGLKAGKTMKELGAEFRAQKTNEPKAPTTELSRAHKSPAI